MNQQSESRSPSTPTVVPDGRRRSGIVTAASRTIDVARATVGTLVSRLPETMHATRAAAEATTGALQLLPDSTLQGLAAGSVGLGAGFYFAGVPRLVAAAAAAPAIFLEAAIALRPRDRVAGVETSG
jgi:hypothetical protein